VITSSPGFKSIAAKLVLKAAVPDETALRDSKRARNSKSPSPYKDDC